jgi:hypothetical protein
LRYLNLRFDFTSCLQRLPFFALAKEFTKIFRTLSSLPRLREFTLALQTFLLFCCDNCGPARMILPCRRESHQPRESYRDGYASCRMTGSTYFGLFSADFLGSSGGSMERLYSRNVQSALGRFAVALFLLAIVLLSCRPVAAIPAFGRKYGMPCSSCHEAWPKLSPFGQQFKDNGYQMGNDRDAPVYQSPAYWPISMRTTPNWHLEYNRNLPVDGPDGSTTVANVRTQGFDLSGVDFLTAGTLAKNISFLLVPSMENTGGFGLESANVRFSNILNSTWFNIKVGKFELDNLLSEKRIMTLSANGGFYQNYHFQPYAAPGSPSGLYVFGLGDNQLGVEWMGHSANDRTRLSVAMLAPTDGNPNFQSGVGGAAGNTYDVYITGSRAFEVGSLGLQRVGGFAYIGHASTYPKYTSTSNGVTTPVVGTGNEPYYLAGFIGMWYFHKLDFTTMYFYGHDSIYLGTNTLPPAGGGVLPEGAHAPTWNSGLIETHYNVNPQLVFTNRYELIRMSQQALSTNPANTGNVDALTFGVRYYPFMSSRAGFAFHNEYSIVWQRNVNVNTITNLPVGLTSSSLMFGFDFAF